MFPKGAYVELGYVDNDSIYAAVEAATDDELVSVQSAKLVFRDADGNEIDAVEWGTVEQGAVERKVWVNDVQPEQPEEVEE